MVQVKAGEKTRALLVEASKKVFYEKGFKSATVKDIVNEANSKLGIFTYHFSSKEEVAVEIYRELAQNLIQKSIRYFNRLFPESTYFAREVASYRLYFNSLYKNEQVRRFYSEICHTDTFRAVNVAMNTDFIEDILANRKEVSVEFKAPYQKLSLEAITSIVCGMEIRFAHDLFCRELFTDCADDSIDMFLYVYFSLFINSTNYIEHLIAKSREMNNALCLSITPYFSIENIC